MIFLIIIVLLNVAFFFLNLLNLQESNMKLSQLNNTLVTVCNRLTAVEAAIRDQRTDPDLPTDAEASIVQINDKIVSLETLAGTTPPSTNPS